MLSQLSVVAVVEVGAELGKSKLHISERLSSLYPEHHCLNMECAGGGKDHVITSNR